MLEMPSVFHKRTLVVPKAISVPAGDIFTGDMRSKGAPEPKPRARLNQVSRKIEADILLTFDKNLAAEGIEVLKP